MFESYSGFWREFLIKCYSVRVPTKDVIVLSLNINNMIFPNGMRPRYSEFIVIFHYPNQLLRFSLFSKWAWVRQNYPNNSAYDMRFFVENIEIYKRRRNCIENWKDYDAEVKEFVLKRIGCRPLYHTSKSSLPLCNKSKQMQQIKTSLSLGVKHGVLPPCKAMENINFKYEELDLHGTEWESQGNFWLNMFIPNLAFKVNKLHVNFWDFIKY